jgi:uncharacterized RDD family membrane protein YckC
VTPLVRLGGQGLRTYVEDEIVQQGGKNVSEVFREILGGFGCDLDRLEDVPEHGWQFHFHFRRRLLWCQVTDLGPYLAIFRDRHGSPAVAHPDFVVLTRRLADALAADHRYRDVEWSRHVEPRSRRAGASRPDDGLEGPLAPGVATGAGADLSPHPFRRWSARFFDAYLVSSLIIVGAMAALRYPRSMAEATFWAPVLLVGLFPLRAVAGLLFNALMLRWSATTPGKWLCGIRIVPKDGGRLSLSLALKRELEATIAGCAIYFPILSTIVMVINYSQLADKGATSWDERRGLVAVHRPNGLSQFALALLVFAPVAAVFFAAGGMMDRAQG